MIIKQLCSPFEIGQSRQTEGKQRQQKLQIQLCSSTAVHLLFNHFDIIVKQYSARLLIFDRIQTFMKNRSFNRPDKSALNKLIAFFLPTPPPFLPHLCDFPPSFPLLFGAFAVWPPRCRLCRREELNYRTNGDTVYDHRAIASISVN